MIYGGKPVSSLSDTVLLIAEQDCANQIEKLSGAAGEKYSIMLTNIQKIADEIAAEKAKRGL